MKKLITLLSMVVMLAFSSQAAYYLVGNEPFGNGWDPSSGVEMTMNNDGTYSFTATINGSIWFVMADGLAAAGDWTTFNDTMRIGPTGGDETVVTDTWITTQKSGGDHGAYKFTGSGSEYTITFNPFINKFKIEGDVVPVEISTYTVAGAPASVFGTEWDPTNTANDMTKLSDGTYELIKTNCELGAGTELAFKVVGNRDWGTCWPPENFVWTIEQSGIYTLNFNFDPNTVTIKLTGSMNGGFDPITGNMYILGQVNGNGWDPSVGLAMEAVGEKVYKATFTAAGETIDENDGIGYSYFSFTSKLGENSDDWSGIAGYRLGALEDGYLLSEDMMGIDIELGGFGKPNSFKVPAGEYEIVLNIETMTMTINPVSTEEEPYKFEKIWEVTDVSFLNTADVRQGFGMNAKFYVNDKATETIYVIGKNGLTTTTYPGGANCGLTRDEAGNLIVSNAKFPDPWAEATIKVINPETNEMKEYTVPEECGIEGRCDFIGFAKGNLMEDGVLYLTGATTSGVSILTITGGEVNIDECYPATCDGLTPTSSTVINYFKDIAGEEALLYVTRNANPMKLIADGENFTASTIALPAKGACNGMFPFVWDEKQLFVYPQAPNYQNAFAIAEAGAEEPIVAVPSTFEGNANTYQANWLNAEVNDKVVIIYQYYPGGNFTVYRLTKNTPEPEPTTPPTISTEETEEGIVVTVTGEGEIHVYVDGVEVENPYTIPYGDEEITVTITATAQGEGMGVSETTTLVVVVPAKPEPVEEGYKIVKVWDITDLSFLNTADVRQGFGMNSKFYVNDKATETIYVIGKNGLTTTTYPGGANCGLTRDEAGNLIVSNAKFPDPWAEATIKVINPETNEMKEYTVPQECGIEGRCDFIGFAKGNLMEDGVLYLTGATTYGVSILTITGGEVNIDECYPATCDGLTPTSSTVINYFKDIAGEEALLYVTRNAAPQKLIFDGENFAACAIALPGKGACNGVFPFVWDEKQFFIYPQLPNYQNAFAVAEAGAEEPIVAVASTYEGNANTYQADWLNAEVDPDGAGVTIYQYYPGGNFAVYRLTKIGGGVEELINDVEKVVANVRYYNIMGQEMQEANGLTIVVTTYTDGSHSAVKVLK
jgi:hypothetical protein